MRNDPIADLLDYDHWCTEQISLNMEKLSPEQLDREFPIGWKSLRKTLHHIVLVAEYWTDRSLPQPSGFDYAAADRGPAAATVSDLRHRYAAAARQMLLSLQALQGMDDVTRDAAWFVRRNHLIHITTHGMHHRAQMIFMLTQLGAKDIIEGGDFGGWANAPVLASVGRAAVAKHL